jgi:RNA polymerase sigma factor (sigma-70 family)
MNDGGILAVLRHLHTLAAARTAAALSDGELLGRFAEAQDEAAFAALVERHGPMVLRVCRRILGHSQDAEDACQATFLVLARRAPSIRKRGSAASWLFGVAARTARKLRARRARRECGGRVCAEVAAGTSADDPSWREVRTVLDEELLRLPEKYRAPLLLCYVEGLTRDEAARRLGLSHNRLRGRLDYGRGLLRSRLTRRGVGLPAALLAGLLAREASAAVPALLAVATVKAAALTAAGRALPPGLAPAQVVALMEGMVPAMSLTKLKGVCAPLLLVAGLGVGAAMQAGPVDEPAGERPKKAAPAGRPTKAVHPINKALEGLTKHYALPEGEILKAFRPPHPEERKEFFRVVRPANDQTEWDGNLILLWKEGGLEFGSVSFGMPPRGQAVETLLQTLAGIAPEEVEGDRDLRWNSLIGGDFVVRAGAPPAKVVARLEEILNQEYNLPPVKLTLREADRTVYVLEGKYKFTRTAPDQAANHIELYANELILGPAPIPLVGRGPGGSFPEFVVRLGRFVDRRVVLGKVEGLPAQVTWGEQGQWPVTPQSWEAEHAPGPVLKRVTEQTGLTVREETRRVRVLVVQRLKEPYAVQAVPSGEGVVAKPRAGDTGGPAWRDEPLFRASQALVNWWPADGHVFDLAGSSHGTRGGSVAFAPGRCGAAFAFPDGKGVVRAGRPAALVNTFTLAVWVNPTAPRAAAAERSDLYAGVRGQRYAVFPTHGGEAGKGMVGCGISVGTNGIGVFEHTDDYCPCVLAHDTPVKGWTHVAVVYAQGRPTLYVNGEAVKTGVRSAWAVFPGTYFGDPDTGYGPYRGLLDEPMLFDRALSGPEIKATIRVTQRDPRAGVSLSDAAFAELWSYLSGERAPRSLFAIDRLAAGGDATVRRLRPLVLPAPVFGKPSVEELLSQLDDRAFKTRERATHLLIERGAGVVPKLRAQLKGPLSPEMRLRVGRVLRHFNDARPTPEALRAVRAVSVLSWIATPSSRALLAELAAGPEAAPATLAAKAALARSGEAGSAADE